MLRCLQRRAGKRHGHDVAVAPLHRHLVAALVPVLRIGMYGHCALGGRSFLPSIARLESWSFG